LALAATLISVGCLRVSPDPLDIDVTQHGLEFSGSDTSSGASASSLKTSYTLDLHSLAVDSNLLKYGQISALQVTFTATSGVTNLRFLRSVIVTNTSAMTGQSGEILHYNQSSSSSVGRSITAPCTNPVDLSAALASGGAQVGVEVFGDLPTIDWTADLTIWVRLTPGNGATENGSTVSQQQVSEYDAVSSVQNAIMGTPSARTVRAEEMLVASLSTQQRAYLEYLDWSNVTKASAENDPAISAALLALQPATSGTQSTSDTSSLRPRLYYPQPNGNLYPDMVAVMRDCWHGEAKCQGTACMAAVVQAHIDIFGPIGAPAPSPVPVDHGTWTCTQTFGKDGGLDAECNFMGFCRNLSFPGKGVAPQCDDLGWNEGYLPKPNCSPLPSTTSSNGGNGGGSNSAAGSNPCFVGNGVAVDPAPWIAACEKLNASTPNPFVCLDAQPTIGIGAATLPNGKDPNKVCKVFTNEDGTGTPLGVASGCDHEIVVSNVSMTCYCCPN
jgi:hypothetical protein